MSALCSNNRPETNSSSDHHNEWQVRNWQCTDRQTDDPKTLASRRLLLAAEIKNHS